jgi:ribosomal protein S18 acetylase RimI-like enzyme
LHISHFTVEDTSAVIDLWGRCGLLRSWNDPKLDIDRKLTDQNGCFLVGHDGPRLIASIMVGYDGHRGSINYMAIDPAFANKGHGKEMVIAAEQFLKSCGCPKVNLCVRQDNEAAVKFYARLGYRAETVHFFGKRLIEDE